MLTFTPGGLTPFSRWLMFYVWYVLFIQLRIRTCLCVSLFLVPSSFSFCLYHQRGTNVIHTTLIVPLCSAPSVIQFQNAGCNKNNSSVCIECLFRSGTCQCCIRCQHHWFFLVLFQIVRLSSNEGKEHIYFIITRYVLYANAF